MNIVYLEKEKLFKLDTPNTTYIIGIVGEEGLLAHIYYGKKLTGTEGVQSVLRTDEPPFIQGKEDRERLNYLDNLPFEYSSNAVGDFRESCLKIKDCHGHTAILPVFESWEIINGKPGLEGLPATFSKNSDDGATDVSTLIITCVDKVLNIKIELLYSVFSDTDAIARSARIINRGSETVYLEQVMSGCIDMDNHCFDVLTMNGAWARERHLERSRLSHGKYSVSSNRGGCFHQAHPFMALLTPNADQTSGEVYGFNFVYSGNYMIQAELSHSDSVRIVCGINPDNFCWKLEPGRDFQSPEMIMVYSSEGLDMMTASFHTLYKKHLIRSPYNDKERPVLINNWEGTYFDFNEQKLIDIAKESAKLGIEMLVMDDGWFAGRNSDTSSLGDWYVNENKLKGGLKYLSDEINKLGMKLGIWFEPEMISPDSDLYREHPDWAVAIPGRTPCKARCQYVLDITRKEVRDTIMEKIFSVLHSANISYVKWDMNRSLTDFGSAALPADRQGELCHRYVLGMYEMQQRLLDEFPDLLLENCSGGGGRFDPGMLYFSPQIWTSDDTDAVERLAIQEGTCLIYPLSAMGAHVSVCPNHIVGRNTPFDTRAITALAGTFGYELDITKLSDEEKRQVKIQTEYYHKLNRLVREGAYYRIASYQQNHLYDCFQLVSPDKSESLVFYVQVLGCANTRGRILKLRGLENSSLYRVRELDLTRECCLENDDTDNAFTADGSVLMNAGLKFDIMSGDFRSKLIYINRSLL